MLLPMTLAANLMARGKDPLRGKNIGVIGDSYVKNHREPVSLTWHYKFARKHHMNYYNYGRNGNCLTIDLKRWGTGVYHRYRDMRPDLDYIIVIGGHNDAERLSEGADTLITIEWFRQNLDTLCQGLISRYPTAQIVFFGPWTTDHFQGSNRQQVVDAMRDVCGQNGIPFFDSARYGGIRPQSDDFRREYFQNQGRHDHAHLNARGHDRFLKTAEEFLLRYVK